MVARRVRTPLSPRRAANRPRRAAGHRAPRRLLGAPARRAAHRAHLAPRGPRQGARAPRTRVEPAGGDAPPAAQGLSEARAEEGATIALIHGERVNELPTDLYIPPEALEVFLETFQGPLDLLLYLIRRQNLDILDIRVAEITKQYMQYIDLMQALQLDLAGEYLVMAAMLAVAARVRAATRCPKKSPAPSNPMVRHKKGVGSGPLSRPGRMAQDLGLLQMLEPLPPDAAAQRAPMLLLKPEEAPAHPQRCVNE